MIGQRIILDREMYGHTLELAKLFYAFSNDGHFDENLREYTFDENTKDLIHFLSLGARRTFDDVSYETHGNTKRVVDVGNNNNVVVCFSGGKDSTAAAITMRDKGYNVFLYYVQGINKSYPNEALNAHVIASVLGMPLRVEKVKLKGTTTFRDNPVKNQLIASMALDWAVENEIGTKICFGDFYTDNVSNSSFVEAWSDAHEMWSAHQSFVRNYVPSYEIIIPFKNYIETMDIISRDERMLNLVQGCVLPHRFRQTTKEKNERKYDVRLLPNRCGSCWKCCTEYVHYADVGVVPFNPSFYKHCLDFLTDKMQALHANVDGRDVATVYRTFLYGDYQNSKMYEYDNKK